MATTKKLIRELELIHDGLARGVAFIQSDNVLVCRPKAMATTTLDYSRPDGSACTSFTKDIGSDLCLIYTALDRLCKLIERETVK